MGGRWCLHFSWNASSASLEFQGKPRFSLMTKWVLPFLFSMAREISDDMSLILSELDSFQNRWGFGICFDLRYFKYGRIFNWLNEFRKWIKEQFNPRDIAIGGTFPQKIELLHWDLGISARFIHSNLSGNISSVGGSESRPGNKRCTDVGPFTNQSQFFPI